MKSRYLAAIFAVALSPLTVLAAPPSGLPDAALAPVTVEITGDGIVISDPAGITCPGTCTASFARGATVTLTATPDPDGSFLTYTGGCAGTQPTCELLVNTPKTVNAFFDILQAAAAAPVLQTGQTLCVDEVGPIDCAGTGQDGELQAGVALPAPRFTDNGDGTVTDNSTGLRWLKDVACIGFFTPGDDAPWTDAFNLVASFNSGLDLSCTDYVPGTFNDWRIANINELHSLVNYGFFLPAISNAQGDAKWSEDDRFVNLPVLGEFGQWAILSSTPVSQPAPNTASINSLIPADGRIDHDSSGFVWAVRGPE